MTVEERWYHEGPPVIEELAERLWAYSNVPYKLPWAELSDQGRVGPRRKAYEMLAIVVRHQDKPFGDPTREPGNFVTVRVPTAHVHPGFGYTPVPIPAGTRLGSYVVADDLYAYAPVSDGAV